MTLPPHSEEAEADVLASVLVDQSCLPAVRDIIGPKDFFRKRHGWIFTAMCEVWDSGEDVNQITVAHNLALKDGDLFKACGGAAYLAHVVVDLPTSVWVESYARVVADCARRRQQIEEGKRLLREAQGPPSARTKANVTELL